MLIVRCSAKFLARLKVRPEPAAAPSTTHLSDWYATILHLRPPPLALLVSEATRLPVVLPSRELTTLAGRIPVAIAGVLEDLGVEQELIEIERDAMAEIVFDKTASRSVLGTMNELAFHLGLHTKEDGECQCPRTCGTFEIE